MTTKPKIKKVAIKEEKVAIIHACTEADKLSFLIENNKRLSEIITGNGDPKSGLYYYVGIIGERQDETIKKLEKIEPKLDGLLSEITEVRGGLGTLKAKIDTKDNAGNIFWQRTIWVIMALLAIVSIIIGFAKLNTKLADNIELRTWQDSLRVQQERGYSPITRSIHYNDTIKK